MKSNTITYIDFMHILWVEKYPSFPIFGNIFFI